MGRPSITVLVTPRQYWEHRIMPAQTPCVKLQTHWIKTKRQHRLMRPHVPLTRRIRRSQPLDHVRSGHLFGIELDLFRVMLPLHRVAHASRIRPVAVPRKARQVRATKKVTVRGKGINANVNSAEADDPRTINS